MDLAILAAALRSLPRIRRIGRLLIPLLALCAPAYAASPCAGTLHELRTLLGDPSFPLEWRETTMDDAKPLVLSIAERDSALFLSVVKQDEGLWAEGASTICVNGDELEVHFFPGKMSLGPAAHWALRCSLEMGADFTLRRVGVATMKIATMGWSGMFSARPPSRH